MDELRTQLQLYNSQFEFFTSQKVSAKSNLIALLDMTYPGVNQFFNNPIKPDGSEKWCDYAELFWHVDCVRSLSLKAFVKSTDMFMKSRAITSNKASVNHSTLQPRILSRAFQKTRNTRL